MGLCQFPRFFGVIGRFCLSCRRSGCKSFSKALHSATATNQDVSVAQCLSVERHFARRGLTANAPNPAQKVATFARKRLNPECAETDALRH